MNQLLMARGLGHVTSRSLAGETLDETFGRDIWTRHVVDTTRQVVSCLRV